VRTFFLSKEDVVTSSLQVKPRAVTDSHEKTMRFEEPASLM